MRKTIKTLLLLAATILVTAFSAAAADEVLMDMNTTGLTISNVDVTQEYTNQYDSSRKIVMKNSGVGAELGSVYSSAKDLSGCKYFNIWAYSPKVSAARFTIDVYNNVNSANTRFARCYITADWQGWKLVSLPFADFAMESGATENDWKAVTKYRVTSYSTLSAWTEGDFLCIDKIWCSTENPYAVAESELIIDHNRASLSNGSLATTNTRVSAKSLKLSSGTSRKEATCTLNNPINITDYSYINMWVYLDENPQYLKDDGETVATPKFKLRLNDGSVNAQTGNSCTETLLDWQGWKLMTIPLSSFTVSGGTLNTANIGAFKVITNENGWTSFKESVDIYLDKIWFSKEAPTAASPIITNVISANGDSNFRLLDSAIELSINKNAVLKNTSTFTVTADSGAVVSATPYLIAPGKVALFLGNKLIDNTTYTVNVAADALFDGDGFANEAATFTFTTRPAEFKADAPVAYNYTAKLVAGTATSQLKAVTKLYNTTNDAKDVMLLVAVYGSDGAMKDVVLKRHTVNPSTEITVDTVSKLENGTYTYASAGSGDSVRCFILENNLAPVSLTE